MERFRVGGFDCVLLGTGQFDVDGPVVFTSTAPGELDAARERFDCARDPLTFQIHPLFVQTESHRVVVDPGSSADGRPLVEELAAAGIAPESIDAVIITHGHADHWSSSVVVEGDLAWDLQGDRGIRPAFPNARYVLQRGEWDHWFAEPNPEPVHAGPFRNILGPLRDRFELVNGRDEVVPGVEVWPAPGHSPGHQVVVVGGEAIHIGDVLLHPICVEHPLWPARFDVWPKDVVAARMAVLDRTVREDLLVVTHHFPWPGFGHVRSVEGRWRWEYGERSETAAD